MTEDISLSEFRSMDEVKALQTYIDALTAFDAIEHILWSYPSGQFHAPQIGRLRS
jgi:hypothetical protein